MPNPNAMHHGRTRREYASVPTGTTFEPGKFGRMFPYLRPLVLPEAALEQMAAAMLDADDALSGDNPAIPAGFTYLGQFVDHDVTFDTTTIPEVQVDPQAVFNFRTPKLELDSVYGLGPALQPYLYDQDSDNSGKLVLGATVQGRGDPTIPAGLPNDVPRFGKVALIGDPRNDENLAVAQMHVAFLKLHNRFVDKVKGAGIADAFEEARRLTIWHYQRMLLDDFVSRIARQDVLDDVLDNGRRFYHFSGEPFMPVEFSVAAYRLGHSQVRNTYDFNRVFREGNPPLPAASMDLLFRFSGVSGDGVPIPSDWIIDWRRFFDIPGHDTDGAGNAVKVNATRRIDPFLASALHDLPGIGRSLPFLNLLRGVRMGLPSGQDVAKCMRLPVLTPDEIAGSRGGDVAAQLGFHVRTPLWLYILKEAQIQEDGLRLGQVGSRIVAEVFVGLLQGDANSFLAQQPDWEPEIPTEEAGRLRMSDLLVFVGELNPIGEAAPVTA